MPEAKWMWDEPLDVELFIAHLRAKNNWTDRLVGFSQNGNRWKAQFVTNDSAFFREASGEVARSREWLKKRTAEGC